MNTCLLVLAIFLSNSGMPGIDSGWMMYGTDGHIYTYYSTKSATEYIWIGEGSPGSKLNFDSQCKDGNGIKNVYRYTKVEK